MILECSCMDGFTGDFCEYKTEQDHLLYISTYLWRSTPGVEPFSENTRFLFNANGRLIEERAIVDEQITAYGSCSTVFNGESIIFGGWNEDRWGGNIEKSRQVNFFS